MRIGIMGAMLEEVRGLIEEMGPGRQVSEVGGRTYHRGHLFGREAVVAFSRWGKVAAATTATHLIVGHGVDEIVFTGVAGAAAPSLRVGDVVVASSLIQHDMDARPLYPRHEIPLLGRTAFEVAPERVERAVAAARRHLRGTERKAGAGSIASGDRFFASQADLDELLGRLPEVLCVEMEGAAVAQVCHEYGVPLTVIRTISDAANEEAPMDFTRFVEEIASGTSHGILKELLAES